MQRLAFAALAILAACAKTDGTRPWEPPAAGLHAPTAPPPRVATAASPADAAPAPFVPKTIPSDRALLRVDAVRAVMAGVLRFKDPRTPSFSDVHRKDAELARLLEARGGKDHVDLLLDEAATVKSIKETLTRAAASAGPDATLVFYYAGHGDRDKKGNVSFLGYDAELSLFEIETILRTKFKGDKVVLLADCCFSGALKQVAANLEKSGIRSMVLASAEASNESTEQWTFTQALIDGLSGAPLVDADGDGFVELSELAGETQATLAHFDHQRAAVGLFEQPPETIVAAATGAMPRAKVGDFHVGEFVEAPRDGKLVTGRLVGSRGDRATVSFFDYADRTESDFPLSDLRAVAFKRYPLRAKVQVSWGGKLWPAEIIGTSGDFHLITYTGWPSYWDEWVLSDRIEP